MNRFKRPDLKLPELRAPDFLADLYYDLRDRRLLPLVALALVAIVAVPILLGGGSEESEPAENGASGGATASSAPTSSLTVVRAAPGLRDYRRRLRDHSPTDPFEQRYTAPDLDGTELGAEAGSGVVTETSTTSTTVTETVSGSNGETSAPPSGENGGSPGGHEAPPSSIPVYTLGIDYRLVRTETKADGSKEREKPQVRREVLPPTPLPSEKTQVVTFIGSNPKTHRVLLVVSDRVSAIYGDAKCLSGAASCQLVEIEEDVPTTFVYGANAVRFKLTVLRVEPIVASHFSAKAGS